MTRRHATIIRLASALCLVSASSLTACQNDQGGSSTGAQAQRDAGPAAEGDGADEGTPSKADEDAQAAEGAAEGVAEEAAATGSEGAEGETGEGETGEPGEVAFVAAPEGYGVFQFEEGAPTEADLPLYGLAGYEVVAIYAKPDKESEKYGFLRIGTRMRVGPAIKNEDCPSGWHQLATGGYACSSRGLVVDKRDPYLAYKPSQVDLTQPFPYKWAYVRKWNTPQWWRAPTAEEYTATAEKQAILESERTGVPLPSEAPAGGGAAGGAAGGDGGDGGDGAGGGDGEDDESAIEGDGGAAAPEPAPEPTPPPQEEPEEEKPPVKIPMSPSSPWLEKGYFLSLGEEFSENGRSFWRTARGGVVEKGNAYPYDAKDFSGAEIREDMSFPVGFVMAKNGTKLLRLEDDNKLHATGKLLEKRTFLDLGEEVDVNGTTYFTVIPAAKPGEEAQAPDPDAPLLLVKQDVIRTPDLQPMPKGLQPWDFWIDVDISKQMLVAYEGSRPVYVTLVSTGKKGTNEEPFDTPTGRYRIYSKQVTSNMDGTTATDGNYAIQDVPWVMYFEGSYALHGAFWHQSFGYVRSHGCVNLGPSDARWLFMWSTPYLPEGWHGVKTSDDNPGTTVVIRKSEE